MRTQRRRLIEGLCNGVNMAFGSPKVAELSKKHDKLLDLLDGVEKDLESITDPVEKAETGKAIEQGKVAMTTLRGEINRELVKARKK